ncbi:MAG: hypothetical protein QNI89_03330 [Desulfobacterales bacterium]|nr:hypothetical protein [Desulfobacterales bacterium]
MKAKSHAVAVFSAGLITGSLGVVLIATTLLYLLNMSEVIAISVLDVPTVQRMLAWTYENLRLSVIPFGATLLLYIFSLLRLKRLLRDPHSAVEKIAQTDHLVDIWINLFFGIGVIWTAIGMRGALLGGLGDLNAQSAAKLGAFSILQRLVDGGILLALSTTIFGAVGGYLLRLVKSLAVGRQVQAYYNRLAEQQADTVQSTLQSIDAHLSQLVATTIRKSPDSS